MMTKIIRFSKSVQHSAMDAFILPSYFLLYSATKTILPVKRKENYSILKTKASQTQKSLHEASRRLDRYVK